MALWSGCEGAACDHLSCGESATRNAIDLGRRDFLKETVMATAGLGSVSVLGGCAALFERGPADVIISNAKIATLNPSQPAANAIAVRGNRVAGVGAMRDLEHLLSAKTVVIDARDHTVIPGINDAHTHFIRAAVRALGWNKDTPNMFGGAIERDASGNPTGLVTSTTSLASLVSVWLRIPRLSPEDQILSTRHFMREHNRLGVTSVVDAGGGGQNYPDNYAAIAKLAADGQMTLRIGYTLFAQAPGKELDNYTAWAKLVKFGEGNDYYRMIGTGEYILYAAGDVANFAKDYPVPPAGVMEKNLTAVVKFIVGQGWPFRQHTSFDASASRVLDVLEQVNREIPLKNLRWGLDH